MRLKELKWAAIVALAWCLACLDCAAAKPVNYGGSNHFLYAAGSANGFGTENSWYLPALNIRPVLGTWHLDPELAIAQMRAARKSGQTAYVLPIWSAALAECESDKCNDGVKDGVWGHVVNYQEDGLNQQHQENLIEIISKASELGFKRMVIRFFHNDAIHKANEWDESLYQRIWGYIRNTHLLAQNQQSKMTSKMEILYDLAGEFGGLEMGQGRQFNTRLWQDYVALFSSDDTLGFSFAYAPGRFGRQRQWYGSTLPKWWAFDIYPGSIEMVKSRPTVAEASQKMAASLTSIHQEMAELRNQPLIIMETFFNDEGVKNGIQTAIKEHRLINIDQVSQWPTTYGSGHFSRDIVAVLAKPESLFNHYRSLIGRRVLSYSSNNADVLAISDDNCSDSLSSPCRVTLVLGVPPEGKQYIAFATAFDGVPKMIACRGDHDISLDWIADLKPLQFNVYLVEQCLLKPPEEPPLATATLKLYGLE